MCFFYIQKKEGATMNYYEEYADKVCKNCKAECDKRNSSNSLSRYGSSTMY